VGNASVPSSSARRARIVLLVYEGVGTNEIVHRVGVSKPTVIAWQKRYAAEGFAGVDDLPKAGPSTGGRPENMGTRGRPGRR